MKQKPITNMLNLTNDEALYLVTGKDKIIDKFKTEHPGLFLFVQVEQMDVPEDQEADLFVESAKQLLKQNDARKYQTKQAEDEKFKRNLAEALKGYSAHIN